MIQVEPLIPIIATINLATGIVGWWVSGKDAKHKTAKRIAAVVVGIGASGLYAHLPPWVQQGVIAAWVATGGYAAWQLTKRKIRGNDK